MTYNWSFWGQQWVLVSKTLCEKITTSKGHYQKPKENSKTISCKIRKIYLLLFSALKVDGRYN